MALPYSLVQNEEMAALTVFLNGKVLTADNTHPNWKALVGGVTQADDDTDVVALERLFDPSAQVQEFFERVSERVTVSGGHIFFDGEEVDSGLSNHILAELDEGNDPSPFVNFLEKVMTNPNEHSRDQLFDWLSRHDFTITPNGNFLAYKGVRIRTSGDLSDKNYSDLVKYPYESINTGRAIVDGKVYSGAIPNGVGAVVEMPRGEVQHDPSVGCHTGLHAGTHDYASNFSQGKVLLVEINPRDVVSVPTDCNWQKIRTCRYTVKDISEAKITTTLYGDLDEDYDDEYDDDEDY
jgi:hypothetical protein